MLQTALFSRWGETSTNSTLSKRSSSSQSYNQLVRGPFELFAAGDLNHPSSAVLFQSWGIDGAEDEDELATSEVLPQEILQNGGSTQRLDGKGPTGCYGDRAEHAELSGGLERGGRGIQVF